MHSTSTNSRSGSALVYPAKTLPDLARITADLPPPAAVAAGAAAPRRSRSTSRRCAAAGSSTTSPSTCSPSGCSSASGCSPASGTSGRSTRPPAGASASVRTSWRPTEGVKRREQRLAAGEPSGRARPCGRGPASEQRRARELARERDDTAVGTDRQLRPPAGAAADTRRLAGTDREPGHGREPAHASFVVAMFVDVVSSTELNEALGDESWSRVRERTARCSSECFEAEGGWEVNVAGDGVLARFEHPPAAARAAIADPASTRPSARRDRVLAHGPDRHPQRRRRRPTATTSSDRS